MVVYAPTIHCIHHLLSVVVGEEAQERMTRGGWYEVAVTVVQSDRGGSASTWEEPCDAWVQGIGAWRSRCFGRMVDRRRQRVHGEQSQQGQYLRPLAARRR